MTEYKPKTLGSGLVRDEDGILAWQGGRHYTEPTEQIKTWWAGELRPGCNARIISNWSSGPCGKAPKHDPDANGRPTKCGLHCAATIEKRKQRQRDRDAEEAARRGRIRAARDAAAAIEPALRQIAAGHNDPRSLAQEVLATLDAARKDATP